MKNIFIAAILMMATVLPGFSQVQFSVIGNTQEELSEQARNQLNIKVAQILSRCSASTAHPDNLYGVEPTIVVLESETAMVGTQVMTVTKGELTLLVKNIKDGNQYYGASYPLKVTVKSGKNNAAEELVKAIRIDNPAFVRFVRVAREKVEAFYSAKGLPLPVAASMPDTVNVKAVDTVKVNKAVDAVKVKTAVPDSLLQPSDL